MARFLEYVEAGLTIGSALEKVGRTRKAYEVWRRTDKEFAGKVDLIRSTHKVDTSSREGNRTRAKQMGFAAWRLEYLGVPTYWHQHQWVDLIEGREPRDLHPAETYEPGRRGRLLINTPPNHSKTTTLTIDYATYRIACDPDIRIAVVSETERMAKKFLSGIKDRLTQPRYARLIQHFAPEGGYQASAEIWSQTQIRVSSKERSKSEKDPTVEALGIGGQIYGARLDLIFVDDAVNGENAAQWQDQIDWLRREVLSRPGAGGRCIIVGTRIAPYDLYGQLRNPDNFGGRKPPWTYLAQPAVLEPATEDHPEGKTLWPYCSVPWVELDELDLCELCDGTCSTPREVDGDMVYPRWDMTHLMNGPREDTGDERSWQIIYQQRAIPEDATFPEYAVQGAVNNRRRWGLPGGLDPIPDGCYFIGSLDPATSGFAFGLVYAVDRKTRMRYVVDAILMHAPTPAAMKNLVKRWTVEYPIREWRIEKTGLLTMFVQDAELNAWLNARSVPIKKHYTGANKWDVDFGVASMSSLFGTWDRTQDGILKEIPGTRFIEIPRLDTPALKALTQQLMHWTPELDPKKVACDAVMALWFAEVGARELLKVGKRFTQNFMKSKYHTPNQLKRRQVVDLTEFRNRAIA